jgi:formate-dependent nitrite reductase membrane component NrfD
MFNLLFEAYFCILKLSNMEKGILVNWDNGSIIIVFVFAVVIIGLVAAIFLMMNNDKKKK